MASFTYRISYCTGSTQPAVGMRTYKKVGTDPILLKCYATYQQFCTMLKLDWLLQLQLLAFSFLGLQELSWQWWVTVGGQLPIGVAWLPLPSSRRHRLAPGAVLLQHRFGGAV